MLYNPGMILLDAENTDGTYGPYVQGNIGTQQQRLPPIFTATCADMDTATVAFMQSDTPGSTKRAILDASGNPYIFAAADFTDGVARLTIPNLIGGIYLWLEIADATMDTEAITIRIGSGEAVGYLNNVAP